jgi:hypothetical protein
LAQGLAAGLTAVETGMSNGTVVIAALLILAFAGVAVLLLVGRLGGRPGTSDVGGGDVRAELEALRRRVERLEARIGEEADVVETPITAVYDYAVEYARKGMIAPEIALRCGISRDEATLIVAMHRRSGEPGGAQAMPE